MNLQVKIHPISERRQLKPRIYFDPENENFMENLVNRTSRPYNVYRKFMAEALESAMKLADDRALEGAKASWSKYAGCSMCPCSPGFVLSGPNVNRFRFDIHVIISQEAAPKTVGGVKLAERKEQFGM